MKTRTQNIDHQTVYTHEHEGEKLPSIQWLDQDRLYSASELCSKLNELIDGYNAIVAELTQSDESKHNDKYVDIDKGDVNKLFITDAQLKTMLESAVRNERIHIVRKLKGLYHLVENTEPISKLAVLGFIHDLITQLEAQTK